MCITRIIYDTYIIYTLFNYLFRHGGRILILLNRTDLPAVILEYETTFDMGNYYVSFVTFRHVEFKDLPNNPMPTMGLAFFIRPRKT